MSSIGFDWADAGGAFDKVAEEVEEVRIALKIGSAPELEEELGDLLFAVVNLTRLAGKDASQLLEAANRKFIARFQALEDLAASRGLGLEGAALEDLELLWGEVKRGERG